MHKGEDKYIHYAKEFVNSMVPKLVFQQFKHTYVPHTNTTDMYVTSNTDSGQNQKCL